MTVRLVDTHCHLSHIGRDVQDVLDEAAAAGVGPVIDIGMGIAGSAVSAERAAASGGRVWASVGLHPNELDEYAADPAASIGRLRELAGSPAVVGVGETGIDLYRDRAPVDLQERAFRDHIALARELDKALVIHCRDAHREVVDVLDSADAPGRVVMHCFSGDASFASVCADRGWFCSFAGNLTYPKSGALRDAAAVVPTDLLLVETDAPFLAPQPVRGEPNAPAFVRHTFDALAAVRGADPAALAERLLANTRAAFRLGA